MLRLTLFTAFLCLFLAKINFAQRFLPATLILQSGDSLNGFYKPGGSNKSTREILFSENDTKNFKQYSAELITALKVNGLATEIYESFHIQFDVSSQTLTNLKNDRDPLWKTGTFLLKLLAAGELNLYKFTDADDRVHFFLAKKGEKPEELIYRKYLNDDVVQINDTYLLQLSEAIKDCSGKAGYLPEAMAYQEKKIIRIVNDYNNCRSGSSYVAKAEKAKVVFSIKGGAGFTSVSLGGRDIFVRKFNSSVRPSFAIGANIIFPGNSKQSSLLFELASKSQKNEGSYTKYVNEQDYTQYNEVYELTYIKLNMMYRRFFTKAKNAPYIQAGFTLGHAVKLSSVRKTDRVFYSTEESVIENIAGMDGKFEAGLTGGIGIAFAGHSALELRYEISNGVAKRLASATGKSFVSSTAFVYYSFTF